jgi:hypothetical protein
MTDHNEIWLEPQCAELSYEGRKWCQDNVWGDKCEDCDEVPTRYVRADIHDALAARLAEAERDAARYRWLRQNSNFLGWEPDYLPEFVDRAVDRAMSTASATPASSGDATRAMLAASASGCDL